MILYSGTGIVFSPFPCGIVGNISGDSFVVMGVPDGVIGQQPFLDLFCFFFILIIKCVIVVIERPLSSI